jgi:hypothetical protein
VEMLSKVCQGCAMGSITFLQFSAEPVKACAGNG